MKVPRFVFHLIYIKLIIGSYFLLSNCTSIETTKQELIEVDKIIHDGIDVIDDIEKIESLKSNR